MEPDEPIRGEPGIATLVPLREAPTLLRTGWDVLHQNADQLGWAWRVLRHGVCDGCALGATGLRDEVLPGIHLCRQRLRDLRAHTRPTLTPSDLTRVERLQHLSPAELHGLGRLPFPFVRRAGERGFSRIGWDEALTIAGAALRKAAPERTVWLVGDRSCNETSFALHHAARSFGSTGVYRCGPRHPGLPLIPILGDAAATCTLSDCIGTDLLLLVGLDPRKTPALARILAAAKDRHTRVVVIDAALEPDLERTWVPERPLSLLFGTRLADDFVRVERRDVAVLFDALAAALLEREVVDRRWVEAYTTGLPALSSSRGATRAIGVSDGVFDWLVELVSRANHLVSLWGALPADGVASLARLHLLRGAVGRPLNGLLPVLPGPGTEGAFRCGFAEPEGALQSPDVLVAFEVDPLVSFDRDTVRAARVRVHALTHLDEAALQPAEEAVLLLPLQSPYEQRGGGTFTSLDRWIRFSPELPDHPLIGEARSAWSVPGQLQVAGGTADAPPFRTSLDVRRALAEAVPQWRGIEALRSEGDALLWGGPHLYADHRFPFPDGRARLR